ncbi:MAG: hypothetical protein ACRD1H_02360, partial [Vicinamibacterales bacterium]
GEVVAFVPFTVYDAQQTAGLILSAAEAGCDETVTLQGRNFEPVTQVVVHIGVEGGPQPAWVATQIAVNPNGVFDIELGIAELSPCLAESFAEPREYIVWAATERVKAGTAPMTYPSQQVTFTLLPPQP